MRTGKLYRLKQATRGVKAGVVFRYDGYFKALVTPPEASYEDAVKVFNPDSMPEWLFEEIENAER